MPRAAETLAHSGLRYSHREWRGTPPHSAYYPAFANKREQGDTDTEADRQGLRAGVGAVIGKGLRLFSG